MLTPKEMTKKILQKFDKEIARQKAFGILSTYDMIKAVVGKDAKQYDLDGFIGEVQELILEE